jgi:hypothetical protein
MKDVTASIRTVGHIKKVLNEQSLGRNGQNGRHDSEYRQKRFMTFRLEFELRAFARP